VRPAVDEEGLGRADKRKEVKERYARLASSSYRQVPFFSLFFYPAGR